MIVVVGGSARKVGKTTVMCEIIGATRGAGWIALKISAHEHEPAAFGDTERYLAAGAAEAKLLNGYAAFEGNVIIESNAALDVISPDLFVFVDGEGEWKPSALKHASRADVIVRGHATPELIERVRDGLNAPRS